MTDQKPDTKLSKGTGLTRQMSLLSLTATGICSMLGASIYVIPFMIQKNVPGIGPYVLPAFIFAAFPALMAAFAYSILASAMPRAGGSYIYASRSLNPFLGFVASFSQWFGLSIVIGVVSYLIVPFFRDMATAMEWNELATTLNQGIVRVTISLTLLWIFVGVNIHGLKAYERTLVPLMFLMFALGAIVIVSGFTYNHQDFATALFSKEGRVISDLPPPIFSITILLTASPLLFSSFIGFDSIAQAGGEAKKPGRNLPIAITITIISVGSFYMLFTASVYHAVPWNFIASESMIKDLTAPGLLSYVISPGWAVAIVGGAAIALINDLPAMLLSVSRLMFAWGEDGIFPKKVTNVHAKYHTPHIALLASGLMASIGILGCHFAGDFFLGVDIMVTSMLVNFTLMCISVILLPKNNPQIFSEIKVITSRKLQVIIAWIGTIMLTGFLIIHIRKDLTTSVDAWYFHSTFIWVIVMALATLIYIREYQNLRKKRIDIKKLFTELPPE